MSRYNPEWTFPVAFPPQAMTNVLSEWVAKQGLKQSHIAGKYYVLSCFIELERYACRDGEVCACHILLQRWRRKAV
jgi:bisphosphoglycerate-independent phosphoglycerate mutase (AlkP superfamily)